jgi:thymidylate kinase
LTEHLHIALMGVDGAGKSTIAAELAKSLRGRGHGVEIVSFKRAMLGDDPVTGSVLAHVAFASLKSQYAEAALDAGHDLDSLLSERDLGAPFPAAERRLRSVPIGRNEPRPFLSSALLEIVGGLWVQTYVESRLRAGVVVIDESYAFKHALKNVLFVQRMSEPGSPLHVEAQGVLDTARSVFGGLLRPTHGYWIDTDPHLALRWRTLAGETTTPFENYGLMGETGDASFLAMQEDCRPAFQDAAREWKWERIALSDRPREENVPHAVRVIEQAVLPTPAGRSQEADRR